MKKDIHPKYYPTKVFHNGELVFTTGGMSALHGWRNVSPAVITVAEPPLVEAGDRARLVLTVACKATRELEALVVELDAEDGHLLMIRRVKGEE